MSVMLLAFLMPDCSADDTDNASKIQTPAAGTQLNVNWLYGAYVPKDVPLRSLTPEQRWKLYVRMTYSTPGIYIKTVAFAIRDQVTDIPQQWGDGGEGFAKRLGSREGQFVLQNSFTALGDGLAGYEVRYDRCRCSGFWHRTGHAFVRNFVTYNRTETQLRPQIPLYAASSAGAVIAAAWQPGNPNLGVKAYQGAITQAWVGFGINWLGEFAPDIKRILHRK